MDYNDYSWERKEILEAIPGYDSSYQIVHFESWSTYEENAWMFILERAGQLYLLEYQYSVMAEDNSVRWEPQPVTEAEALQAMIEWEEAVQEVERYMSRS